MLIVAVISSILEDHRKDLLKEEELLTRLTPEGARLLSQTQEERGCTRHVVRKLHAERPAIEAWAERLRLRCVQPDAMIASDGGPSRSGIQCTEWRGDNPMLTADSSHGYLLIDSAHDYLCGGPFR